MRLRASAAADALPWRKAIPAVQTLRPVGIQTYPWTDHDTLRGRMQDETPPTGHFIRSPADCAARNSQQPGMTWLGDQVQLTASGAADRPHRIPHGATTPATTADDVVTAGQCAATTSGTAASALAFSLAWSLRHGSSAEAPGRERAEEMYTTT